MPFSLTNLNPDPDIGASAWWLEIDGRHLLLDAGIHPKREGRAGLPLFSRMIHHDLDAIAISHCHHDHVGALPVALRHFPHAHVYMTGLSYLLVERVLHNSVNVMQRQRDALGIPDYPLYTHEQVDDYAAVFQGVRYNREIDWAGFRRQHADSRFPSLEFLDAGHALGSAGVMVRGRHASVFYSGDVCFHDQTLLRAAQFDDVKADVLVMESTRGARELPAGFSRESEAERLCEAIRAVQARKGCVLIPAFALGRTQEVLALLALMQRDGRLRRQTVYIGGLGRVFTEIYDLEAHRASRHHSNLRLTEALDVQVLSREDAQRLKLSGGKIFVLTSGMMNENTVANDIALRLFADERHGILFVGYTDPETPGGRLRMSQPGRPFAFALEGLPVTRRCQVAEFDLTAHANRDDLVELVGRVSPKTLVLGHGDAAARQWIASEVKRRMPRLRVVQPDPGGNVLL